MILDRFRKAQTVRELYTRRAESLGISILGVQKQQADIQKELSLEMDTAVALRRLLESTSEKSLSAFTDLLNQCFSAVFYDRDFTIGYKIGKGRRREIKFYITELIEGEQRVAYFPSDTSGSMNVVFSFILQVFLIQIYKKRRFVVIDEAVSREVSNQYLPYLMEFITSLCKELDFTVLWVTHDERIIPYMNKVYELDEGKVGRELQ